MELHLIGVPFNSAGRPGGVANAPEALRIAGIVSALGQVAPVHDVGDLSLPPPRRVRSRRSGLRNESALVEMVLSVRDELRAGYSRGRMPILLGGDCPVLLGGLAAARDNSGEPVGLLFLDGHEDAWPPKTSTTGEAADAELGLALSQPGDTGLPAALAALLPLVQPEAVAVLGARDQDELAEAGVARLVTSHPGIWLRTDRDLADGDLDQHAREALTHIRHSARIWWLHTDLDVLSTSALPAVDYPQPGGLSWSQLTALTRHALATSGCVGWTITIYNPDLDPDAIHARRIVEYIKAAGTALTDRIIV